MTQLHAQRRRWTPVIRGDVAYVPLGTTHEAMVDVADLPLLVTRTWSAVRPSGRIYAAASSHRDGTPSIYMHRHILGLGPGDLHVDHVNGDGLDNRRANLRPATRWQNMANQGPRRGTSSFKGVSWSAREGKWRAYVKAGGRQISAGHFVNEVEAAKAHDDLALKHHGEFAYLNFPDGAR